MGCSKNLVDSERLGRMLAEKGWELHHNPDGHHGDVVVVNTCGFIGDAKEESVQMVCDLCQDKADGRLGEVYVMGCLSERYREELSELFRDVDGLYGKFDWAGIVERLGTVGEKTEVEKSAKSYCYLKISEGCDRKCAYCAIPLITGRHQSRSMEDILDEVRRRVAEGITEFQVIAQELTYYGVDNYGSQKLPELIEKMARIDGVKWIRLHYAYPTHFPMDLLRVMRENDNVCKYLDIALQHISDDVLKRMRRHITKAETLELIEAMRREVPGICLRTTLMVGFPGETDEDFAELTEFVKTVKFDRMGAFAYSEEEGTYAAEHYSDDVPDEVKQDRLSKLMRVQQRISEALNAKRVGETVTIVIDRLEGAYYVGRTEKDSPEVDGEVLVKAEGVSLTVGDYYAVKVVDSDEFDLYGEIIEN